MTLWVLLITSWIDLSANFFLCACNHSDLPIESSVIYGKNTPVLLLKWLEHGAHVFESWTPGLPCDLCISNCDKCEGIDSGLGAPTQPKKFHQVRVHVLRAWQAFFWGRQQLNIGNFPHLFCDTESISPLTVECVFKKLYSKLVVRNSGMSI